MINLFKKIFSNKNKENKEISYEEKEDFLQSKKEEEKIKKPYFFVYNIGLLFIVYEEVDTGLDIVHVEESRWECEEKANKHCKLLNS